MRPTREQLLKAYSLPLHSPRHVPSDERPIVSGGQGRNGWQVETDAYAVVSVCLLAVAAAMVVGGILLGVFYLFH